MKEKKRACKRVAIYVQSIQRRKVEKKRKEKNVCKSQIIHCARRRHPNSTKKAPCWPKGKGEAKCEPMRHHATLIWIYRRVKNRKLGIRGHWMFWWVWKSCESYVVAFAVTRSQPSLTLMDKCVCQNSTTTIKTPNERMSFGRKVLFPLVDLYAKDHGCQSAS